MNSLTMSAKQHSTKSYAILLGALMIWQLILIGDASRFHTPDKPCVAGIRGSLGVQMELVRDASQVDCLLLGGGRDGTNPNWHRMRVQQYLDFVFIPLYWAVVWFAIGSPLRRSGTPAGRNLAVLVRISISLAAIADYLEDMAIFRALQPGYDGLLWPADFGFPKWILFFVSLGFAAAFFLIHPRLGAFSRPPSHWETVAARVIGVLFLAGALLGLIGAIGALRRDWGPLLLLALLPVLVALILLEVWLIRASRRIAKAVTA